MTPRFEAFLARLYVDELFLDRFLAAPDVLLFEADLGERERAALLAIDRPSLRLAARSFRRKRELRRGGGRAHGADG